MNCAVISAVLRSSTLVKSYNSSEEGIISFERTKTNHDKLPRDLLESDPVDLLFQARPDEKLKPRREAKPPEKKFPSHKESAEQSCYRYLGNHDCKSCTKGKNVSTVTRPVVFKAGCSFEAGGRTFREVVSHSVSGTLKPIFESILYFFYYY